jgi:hypothetical protein
MAKKATKKETKPKATPKAEPEAKAEKEVTQPVEGEGFYIDVVPHDSAAEELLALMEDNNLTELELPVVPIAEISNFIDGSRPELFTYTIDDLSPSAYFEVRALGVGDAKALRGALKSNKLEGLPVPPLDIEHLKEFVSGKRKNVAQLEIVRTTIKKEDLPGHME